MHADTNKRPWQEGAMGTALFHSWSFLLRDRERTRRGTVALSDFQFPLVYQGKDVKHSADIPHTHILVKSNYWNSRTKVQWTSELCFSLTRVSTARKWQQDRPWMLFWQWHREDWFRRSFRQTHKTLKRRPTADFPLFRCLMYHQSWTSMWSTISVTFAGFRMSCSAIDCSHAI